MANCRFRIGSVQVVWREWLTPKLAAQREPFGAADFLALVIYPLHGNERETFFHRRCVFSRCFAPRTRCYLFLNDAIVNEVFLDARILLYRGEPAASELFAAPKTPELESFIRAVLDPND